MFHWLEELFDTAMHVRHLRQYWRIYVSVALGFGLAIRLASLMPQDSVSVPLLVLCLVAPGIAGALWHRAANRD
jgi:hypothetical protein